MNFLTLIPVIFEIVRLIEKLLPESKGKEKFDAAFNVVEQVYGVVTDNKDAITKTINTTVALLNATGEFTKKSAELPEETAFSAKGE